MKAYNDFRGFADPADAVVARERLSPFARGHAEEDEEIHNARGLIIAVALSAACWAVVGLAIFS